MYIVAIAWIYVVFMMSITEDTVVAGVMTFALYGILPLTIILYIMGTPQRKRRKATQAAATASAAATESGQQMAPASTAPDTNSDGSEDGAHNVPKT